MAEQPKKPILERLPVRCYHSTQDRIGLTQPLKNLTWLALIFVGVMGIALILIISYLTTNPEGVSDLWLLISIVGVSGTILLSIFVFLFYGQSNRIPLCAELKREE